jgi:FdhE protein
VPYVGVAQPSTADITALAERRWRTLVAARPELQSAVDLQRGLLMLVIDLARTVESGRLPRLSLPGKYLAAKLSRGIPVFAGEPIPLPVGLLRQSLVQFCAALAVGGAGEAAEHIASTIDAGRLDAGSLLTASLARDEHAIRTGATHLDLAPDLTWLVAELAVGPVAHALQRTLLGSASGPLTDALGAWNEGYCPACGSWPALAEVVDGHRLLRCAFCAATWERTVYACVYCNESGEAFVTAAPDSSCDDRRIEVCRACGAYLKTVDVAAASPFPLVAIADMETMDLDVAAMQHQYGRPPLRAHAVRIKA